MVRVATKRPSDASMERPRPTRLFPTSPFSSHHSKPFCFHVPADIQRTPVRADPSSNDERGTSSAVTKLHDHPTREIQALRSQNYTIILRERYKLCGHKTARSSYERDKLCGDRNYTAEEMLVYIVMHAVKGVDIAMPCRRAGYDRHNIRTPATQIHRKRKKKRKTKCRGEKMEKQKKRGKEWEKENKGNEYPGNYY